MSELHLAIDDERLTYWHRHGFDRAVATTDRFVEMVRLLGPDQLTTRVPGMDWSVVEVVAHVASVYRRYTVNPRRAADREQVAVQNADDLLEFGTDVQALTNDMVEQLASLEGAMDLVEPGHDFEFHAGQPITLAGGWGNMIGELLAHGDDIARATGVDWTVDGADLEPVWRFTARALPGWFSDRGRAAKDVVALDLGFDSGPVHLRFTGGGIAIDEPDSRAADHTITGDAVETTLVAPYRRRTTTDPELEAFAARFEQI